jgi:hypothetical protein
MKQHDDGQPLRKLSDDCVLKCAGIGRHPNLATVERTVAKLSVVLSGSRGDGGRSMERVKGIEPSYAAWEAAVLPLNYTREWAILRGIPAIFKPTILRQ